ncbi:MULTISPECIES: Rha family transcriptional regulator [unclassified Dehalobacter]|jgi:phage regulatory protein, rha family|uniref:Rha family transcriptional regulator n=1 Tax=unclassified Dehalobacter TaxID=2635733 RepID=UPI00028B70C7|nr:MULTISPECIES: Rha family transcriptional regulator [unclassified Dehalobacter]AFV02814.1 phage regulatory protein, rha family [Dehalobacter sp. DCA]AFV05799.1 phage regulatory protein, rha family [Dehalobacter sp. CF]
MNEFLTLGIISKKERALVSSRKIAERFNKDHAEVLKRIHGYDRNGKHVNGILDDFEPSVNTLRYFIPSEYKDSKGETRAEYLITRDGFSILAMGFNGKEALKWKIKYINAFNAMEDYIREKKSAEWQQARLDGKQVRREETDVILTKLIPLVESQGSQNAGKLYMAYSKLVNMILGIESGQRENLPLSYIEAIKFLERAIENIISLEVEKGTHYKEIYQVCKAKCQIIKDLAFLPSLKLIS